MKNLIACLLILFFAGVSLAQKETDSLYYKKRNMALAIWDFQLADYYFGKISINFRDTSNLKRKWLNNINFKPQVNSVTDFDLSKPFGGFEYGFGIHPTSKWGIQQQFNSQGVHINNISGNQSNYQLSTNYRINEKWEIRFNYYSQEVLGFRNGKDTAYITDTISFTEPIVNQGQQQQLVSGQVNKGSHTSTFGLVRHDKTFKVGGFIAVRNSYLNDSLIGTTKDSLRQINGNNFVQWITGETIDAQHSFTALNYHQLSLFGQWQPKAYNSGLRFTSWLEIPFDEGQLGFSPFFQTELLLTPNTWIGGWVRDYTNSIEPIENAGLIQNFGYDEVYLKYGGFVNYQKSKRWWVKFNIEVQRRKAFQSPYKYSTLSLGFKFTYRLI